MEARLTEFSYGYCVTEELANGLGPGFKAAPYFPSLCTEGKEGGGFDVQIGSALFLQFKLCEEMTRKSAKETKRGILQPTFFRFWLHRRDRSSQHRMLIDLEGQTGNQVYYCVPAFADINSLNSAYNATGVVSQSAMFIPSEIGPLLDDGYHSVAFRPDQDWGWFLSEPKQVRVHHGVEVLKRAAGEVAVHGDSAIARPTQKLDSSADDSRVQDWLRELASKMRLVIQQNEGSAAKLLEHRRGPLEEVAYLARTHFGCELFIHAVPRITG